LVSAGLATPAGKEWGKNICLPSALLSGALSIMHPPLYHASLEARQRLDAWSIENDPVMQEALGHWSTSLFDSVPHVKEQLGKTWEWFVTDEKK